MRRIFLFLGGITWLAFLGACNFPVSSPQAQPSPDFVKTAAAQTVEAQLTAAAVGAISTTTPLPLPDPDTPPPDTQTPPTVPPAATALPSSTPAPPTATQIPCDRAGFVRDVSIPDDTEIGPGQTFQKTWRLRNTGSCTWNESYSVIFVDGDAMGGPAAFQLTNGSVPPGSEVDITVDLKAPVNTGTYRGNWRLRNQSGIPFGLGSNADRNFWVQIKVVAPTATPDLGFSLTYMETHSCGGTPHAILQVTNNGNADLESAQLTLVDLTAGTTLSGPTNSNGPFQRLVSECPPGGERLRVGQTKFVGLNLGSSPTTGNQAEATVRLCTQDNLGGACMEADTTFSIP